jgi:hypothetical protein
MHRKCVDLNDFSQLALCATERTITEFSLMEINCLVFERTGTVLPSDLRPCVVMYAKVAAMNGDRRVSLELMKWLMASQSHIF